MNQIEAFYGFIKKSSSAILRMTIFMTETQNDECNVKNSRPVFFDMSPDVLWHSKSELVQITLNFKYYR